MLAQLPHLSILKVTACLGADISPFVDLSIGGTKYNKLSKQPIFQYKGT